MLWCVSPVISVFVVILHQILCTGLCYSQKAIAGTCHSKCFERNFHIYNSALSEGMLLLQYSAVYGYSNELCILSTVVDTYKRSCAHKHLVCKLLGRTLVVHCGKIERRELQRDDARPYRRTLRT